jgi:glycerophosphoryl diester phosphodiesterase
MAQDLWPQDRLVYSVGGQNLEKLYFWTSQTQLVYDRMKKRFNIVNYETPPDFNPIDTQAARKIINTRIVPFMETLFPLNKFLVQNNAYSPSGSMELGDVAALPNADKPIFVSHRGNTSGMLDAIQQNKGRAIETAIDKGFDWVEVDVNLTRDSIPVLIHDAAIKDASGNPLNVYEMTLPQLKSIPGYADLLTLEEAMGAYLDKIGFAIEIKHQKWIDRNLVLNRKAVDLINESPLKHKIIVDSFNELSAKFIKNRCDCQVGLDTPYKKPVSRDMLKAIRYAGLDWVYVHYSVVNAALIQNAHELGLKVMTYTVNDDTVLDQWRSSLPDGIITDHVQLKNNFTP